MPRKTSKSFSNYFFHFLWMGLGAFLGAFAIRVFLFPNQLIDGGIVGIALILARLFGEEHMSLFLVVLTLPFVYLAYKAIRRSFVIYMMGATLMFALFLLALKNFPPFIGDPLEIIVIGGALLGIGSGLIIRNGGCVDGTEILAILVNRRKGFTVGQVVLVINVFIFSAYGFIFYNWHIAVQSLMMYIVAFKMIDLVIVGLDEIKSALIISTKPKELSDVIINELGLGLTIMHGQGGFSGDKKEILFVIVERLDLSELKEIVLDVDPDAFIAIENLHEVVYGKKTERALKKKRRPKKSFFSS